MTKSEYLESQRGVPYREIVAKQPVDEIEGSIRGENLRDVVTVFAAGLKHRLDIAPPSPTRTAILTAYDNLTLPDFALNLGLPAVRALLDAGVDEGLMLPGERAALLKLATYERSRYNITFRDCVSYFEPSKIAVPNIWSVLDGAVATSSVVFLLREPAPEPTTVLLELQDVYPDNTESEWYFGTAIRDVGAARAYRVEIPNNGYPRRVRWYADYVLNAELLAV